MARVGLVERVESRAGEQLAQQARGLGGLLVLEVHLGRPQPRLGVFGVGVAPAAVRLERRLRVVLLARERRLELDHGGVVRGRLAGGAQGPLHAPQVAVFEGLPAVVEQAFELRVRCAFVGHGATVPRRRSSGPAAGR